MAYNCKLCGTNSDVSEFYSGVTSRCKECHKAAARKNRQDNVDYYRKYDAERFQNDPRVRERHKRYAATDRGKASLQASRVRWLSQNPDKRAAHIILGNAVRDGKIEKPKNCSMCGAGGRIEGHHDDYTKPLEVTWCCPTCHKGLHSDD